MTNDLIVTVGQGNGTRYMPLAQVAPLVRREVVIDPAVTYVELGVRSFHKGTFHRRSLIGADFSWQDLYRVNQGDLVFSNIMAWEGAVAMAGPQDDGCIGNHRMLTCACDPALADPEFLAHYFTTAEGMVKLVGASTGTVARNRTLTATALGRIEVPIPPLPKQQRVVQHLKALNEKTRKLVKHLDAIEAEASALLRTYVFCPPDATVAKRRLSDLVVQRPPDVAVSALHRYQFAGVYSFGRGVFASASKAGSEFAYERLSTVRTGDFIYPKLMAWEGALGVVPPECDGMVVSPEFPVFSVNTALVIPEVLDIYFRTPDVWPALAGASGGTNMRRRRLQPSAFLAHEMPVPSMKTQQTLRELQRHVQALKCRHAAIRAANDALVAATLERIFKTVGA